MKSGCTVSVIRRRGVLPIVCALVLSVEYSEPSLAQTAQAYREQADALARSKSWEQAVAAYRSQLPLEPDMFPEFLLQEIFGREYFEVVPTARTE